MTSRERLMAVLQHKIPDRVPVSTYDMTGWHYDPRDEKKEEGLADYVKREIFTTYLTGWWNQEPSYQPLMEYLRKNADCLYMTDVPMTNAYTARNTHIEQRKEGNSTYTRITLTTPKGDLTQEFRVDKGVYTAWEIEHRIKDISDVEKYLSIPYEPVEPDVSHLKVQDEFIGEHGILLIDVPDPISDVFGLFDFQEFLLFAYSEEELMFKMLDKAFEEQYDFMERILKKGAGPLFRFSGPEVCTPPFLSNEYFEKYVVKYDKPLIRLIHDYGQYARIHAHGKVKTVLKYMLDMETDATDPLEAPISGDLTLAEAKQICGDKMCLFGNIQLKDLETMPAGRMREIVKRCVEEGKPGGNFVALPTATPLNVPLSKRTEENFHIFVDTVLEYGKY